jgi:uncharacterized membrane protein YfcA
MMAFGAIVAVTSVVAGGIAALAGFGIGSLLTPVFALRYDMTVAVAAVSVPHLVATALRLWMLRAQVDWRVVRTFGVMSAAGGLSGALLQQPLGGRALVVVFAGLLLFAGASGMTGLSDRMRFGRRTAWAAGLLSGLFGGLVGNQGGIRSAALLGFHLAPGAFVASATATALMVDLARMPVYAVVEGDRLRHAAPWIALATAGAVAGTLAGTPVLGGIPPRLFRRLVSALIFALGLYMAVTA